MMDKELVSWFSNSNCLLLYFYNGSGWWTNPNDKLFLNEFNEGKGGSLPVITIVDFANGKTIVKTTFGLGPAT